MKKLKVSRDEFPPPSLFPHEVRRRAVLVFVFCCRKAAENDNYAMSAMPREIVRMICGWVKADFSDTWLVLNRKRYRFRASYRDSEPNVIFLAWEEYLCREGKYYWEWNHNVCLYCLSFRISFINMPMGWLCDCEKHTFATITLEQWKQLELTYELPKLTRIYYGSH